ncbi:MAG: beta-lactamase family protein, partial [Actinobacteria bacterium]|nr:beta-lactamase family protein [Actinomycetota bacterium]
MTTATDRLAPLAGDIPCSVAMATGTASPVESWFGVDPAARFQAASISKPVGAVVALSLVADGVVGLDDDVTRLLRSWQLPTLGGWRAAVTLRHLLTHSAGLTVHGFVGTPRDEPPPSLVDILDGRSNSPRVVLDVPPGLVSRYSGGGYVALEQLLLDLTGTPFPELAEQRVLKPAGMSQSGYADPQLAAPSLRVDGTPVPGAPNRYAAMVGGLWSTPADLVRFAQAVQQGVLLPTALNREFLTEQLPEWGLGTRLLPGVFGHSGANEGYRCRLMAATDGGWSAGVMTGSEAGGRVCVEMLNALAASQGWDNWPDLPVPLEVAAWSA